MERKVYEKMEQKELSDNGQTIVKNSKRNNFNSSCYYNSNTNNISDSNTKFSIWRRRLNKKSRTSKRNGRRGSKGRTRKFK